MRYKKADRIMKILELLTRDRRPDSRELSERFNVSERTVFRDLSTIANIIPILFEDGYSFAYTPAFPDFHIDINELIVMRLGLEVSALSGKVKYSGDVKSLTERFIEKFDELYKMTDNIIGKELYIDIDMYADYSSKTDIFTRIEKALRERRVVEIRYFSLYKNEETTRNVNPYALVFKRHAWYLIAYCHLRDDFRTFRIERVKDVRLTDENFERIEDFTISEYFKDAWELSRGVMKEKVKIRFHPDVVPLLIEGQRHHTEKFELLVDGSLIYNIVVSDLNEVKRWILSFGDRAEVLEPETLRDDIKKTATDILSKYTDY